MHHVLRAPQVLFGLLDIQHNIFDGRDRVQLETPDVATSDESLERL